MGIIDGKTKQYVKRPEVFADLFNYLLYDGAKVVQPEHLSEMDTADVVFPKGKDGKSLTMQKYRDVLKNAVIMEDSRAAYMLILGVENQDRIHYAMPVRNMLYDAISYSSQVTALAREHRRMRDSCLAALRIERVSGCRLWDERLEPPADLSADGN